MTHKIRTITERYVEELEAALDSLNNHGNQVDEFDLASEMLLLLRGTTEQLLDFWAKAPRKYMDNEVGDYARRDVAVRHDRADLLDMMDHHCRACWALEDLLKIPLGPSRLRKLLIVKPRDHLLPNDDSDLVARDGTEVHRLAIAVACADIQAVQAVEATEWILAESTPAQWAQARLNGAAACWSRKQHCDAMTRLQLLEFASAQWHQALAEGADPLLASFDGNVLRGQADDRQNQPPLEALALIANQVISARQPSERQFQELNVVRDMIWAEGTEQAQQSWCFVLDINRAARQAPPKVGWPMSLDGSDALDPFLLVLQKNYSFEVLEVIAQQADFDRAHTLSDERLRRWVDGLADTVNYSSQKYGRSQYGWLQRCRELQEWLDKPGGAPLHWMNPEQQQRWHTFRDRMRLAMTHLLDVWDQGQKDIAQNRTTSTDFLESPPWREALLEANFSRQWGDMQRPIAGPRPRF